MRRALNVLAHLPGVRLVNLQFADDPAPATHPAFETRAALLRGFAHGHEVVQGPRKPTMRELLDWLVEVAEEQDCAYAGILQRRHRGVARRDCPRRPEGSATP